MFSSCLKSFDHIRIPILDVPNLCVPYSTFFNFSTFNLMYMLLTSASGPSGNVKLRLDVLGFLDESEDESC